MAAIDIRIEPRKFSAVLTAAANENTGKSGGTF